jgi:hypothetical protein
MPKITEDKEEAIWETYQRNKSYAETANLENVDWRTVARVVRKKKKLRPSASNESSAATAPHGSDNKTIEPDLERQLKANAMFAKGHRNEEVSRRLKLPPKRVIDFRREYDEMVAADLNEDTKAKREEKIALEQSIHEKRDDIQQKENRLQELDSAIRLEEEKSLALRSHDVELEQKSLELEQIRKQLDESDKALIQREELLKTHQEQMDESEMQTQLGIIAFIRKMESLPDWQLLSCISALHKSRFFREKLLEPIVRSALKAITDNPKKNKFIDLIRDYEHSSLDYDYGSVIESWEDGMKILMKDTYQMFALDVEASSALSRHTAATDSKDGQSSD